MTPARLLSRSDDKISEELLNFRLRPFWKAIAAALLPISFVVLMIADFLTGASIRRAWIVFCYLVFQTPKTPAVTLLLSFLYDLLVLVLLALLPATIMLVYGKCPNSARAVVERFMLFGLPVLLLWHSFFSLLLLPRTPLDLSTNADSTFWGHIIGLSIAAQYLCWGVTLYMLPAPFRK